MAKIRSVPITFTFEPNQADELTRTIFAPNATIDTGDTPDAPGAMLRKAHSMQTRASEARKALRARLNGLRILFGLEVAYPLDRHLEEYEDCNQEIIFAYEETLRLVAEARRADAVARQEIVGRLSETGTDLRRILTDATAAEEDRMARTAISRRRIPEWYTEAVDHLTNAEEPF